MKHLIQKKPKKHGRRSEKEILNRETESLFIAAQNNGIRKNRINGRIDKTQQNSKCSLHGDKDETINYGSKFRK